MASRLLFACLAGVVLSELLFCECRKLHEVADEEGDPAGLADLDALITGEVSLGFAGMQAVGANTSSVTVIPGNFTAEFTVIANATAAKAELPILFLYATWNVEVGYYSQLLTNLTSRGYSIIYAYSPQDFPFPVEGMPFPGCPEEQIVPSAATLTLFSQQYEEEFAPLLPAGPSDASGLKVVLMGASTAGWAAMLTASGKCGKPWELMAPPPIGDPEDMVYCNGYSGFNGTVLGAVNLLGTPNVPGKGLEFPPGIFTVWVGGEWDRENGTLTQVTFEASTGGNCSRYLKLSDLNDYAWLDWIDDSATGQRPKCAAKVQPDPFFPDEEQQVESIRLAADVVDAAVRSEVLGDQQARQWLDSLDATNPRCIEELTRGCPAE